MNHFNTPIEFEHDEACQCSTCASPEPRNNLAEAAEQISIASYEHPGYISITVGNAQFHFGDANGPIGWDVGPADDPSALRDGSTEAFTIPADSSVDRIKDYIIEVIETMTGKPERDWHPGSSAPPEDVTTSVPPQVAHMDALFAHPGNVYQWHEKVRSLRQLAIRFENELIGLRQAAAESEPTSEREARCYAVWKKPHWKHAFRKGPMKFDDAWREIERAEKMPECVGWIEPYNQESQRGEDSVPSQPDPLMTIDIRTNGERRYLLGLVKADHQKRKQSANPTTKSLERCTYLERQLEPPKNNHE